MSLPRANDPRNRGFRQHSDRAESPSDHERLWYGCRLRRNNGRSVVMGKSSAGGPGLLDAVSRSTSRGKPGSWLFGYFMMGSGMIRLTVPTRISLSGESIIGDFRRPKWTGSEFREIRYEDIRSIGRTRVFRIPVVRGNPDYRRNKPIKDTSLLYLSSDNIERVNAVIRQRRTPNP